MSDPQFTQQQITQTTIPDYARRYVENMLGAGESTLFRYKTDAAGKPVLDDKGMPIPEGFQPYQQYIGERQAQFTPLQQQAFEGANQLRVPGQMYDASQMAKQATQMAGQTAYKPSNFQSSMVQAPQLSNFQMQGPLEVQTQRAYAAQMGAAPQAQAAQGTAAQFQGPAALQAQQVAAERVNAPQLQALSMQAAKDVTSQGVTSRDIQAAQSGYNPQLQQYQMGPAERVSAQNFGQTTADQYMSPYMQSVVGIQQREAQRAADIAKTQTNAQAVNAGAFGGSRQAIMDAEAARNLALQKGDIQAKGLQDAYTQAQSQFNADQARQMQAAGQNQQAGLTVGQQNLNAQLGVQQLGAGQIGLQTSLANLNNQQQASVQNEANRLQASGMSSSQAMQAALANQGVQQQANLQNLSAGLQTQGLGAQTGLQAQQANQQTGLQALLANQQTGLQAGQSNQNMQYNTALQNAQLAQQTGMANTANQQQANLANQALMGQYGMQQGQFNQAAAMQNPQLAQQAMLANQQMGYNVNNANLQSLLGTQQLGTGQSMQAQLANQQAMNAMNQLNEQSSQYGAGLGLQGLQTALSGAGQLGNLGQNIYAQNQGNLNMQNQMGTQQQAQIQNMLNNNYQDFQNAQNMPYKQMGFMSDLLRGTQGLGQSNIYQYNATPSPVSQLAGLGTAAYGASKLLGSANGGVIKDSYADGGMTEQPMYAHAFDNGSGYARGGRVKGHGLADLALSRMA